MSEPDANPEAGQGPIGVIGSIQARAKRFFDLLARLADEDDVELIHDIRVFSRRFGEGLALMRPFVDSPDLTSHQTWLRDTRRTLAPLRDGDVMRQVFGNLVENRPKLARLPVGVAFLEALARQRTPVLLQVRGSLPPAVASERRRQAEVLLEEAVDRAPSRATLDSDLSRRLRRRVRRRRKAFQALARMAAKSGRPGDLHAARIAGKKIRYALELADEAEVLDAAREVKWLRQLQDWLGNMNDLGVLQARLAGFSEQAPIEQQVGTRKLVTRIERQRARAIDGFVSSWPKIRRRLRKYQRRSEMR